MRTIIVKPLPATNTKPYRFRAYDIWHSMIVSRSHLERKYADTFEDLYEGSIADYETLTLAAASHFMQEKYPYWCDEVAFIKTALKIAGEEVDVYTTYATGRTTQNIPCRKLLLASKEVTHG